MSTITVEVDVDTYKVLDEIPDCVLKQELLDRELDIDYNIKQTIIDIVFDNDKKHALQELESLFDGMYTGWEKV